jgi:two-component system CheB/CheR fusion protein
MVLNARGFAGRTDRPELILLAFEDATERKLAERHRELLLGELSHRVKNSLAVVQSISAQTLRNSKALEEFREAFTGRIHALARAHDIVFSGGFRRIALDRIIGQALHPFMTNGQIEIADGPPVDLDPIASQTLTLMLHELATNALKYGALSTGDGAVSVGWRIDPIGDARHVVLSWTERGGPAVTTPARTGQGTRFIKGSIQYELQGEATLDFQPDGLRATIAFPIKKTPNATEQFRPGEEP